MNPKSSRKMDELYDVIHPKCEKTTSFDMFWPISTFPRLSGGLLRQRSFARFVDQKPKTSNRSSGAFWVVNGGNGGSNGERSHGFRSFFKGSGRFVWVVNAPSHTRVIMVIYWKDPGVKWSAKVWNLVENWKTFKVTRSSSRIWHLCNSKAGGLSGSWNFPILDHFIGKAMDFHYQWRVLMGDPHV